MNIKSIATDRKVIAARLNKLAITMAVIIAVIVAAWLNNAWFWVWTGVRYSVNSEYVCVMQWSEHGYDSWGFEYSHGHQYHPDGTVKNLWHYPTWRRCHWSNKETK